MADSEITDDTEGLSERVTALERTLEATRAQLRSHIKRAKSLKLDLNLAAKIHRTLLPQPIRNNRIDVDVRYVPFEKVGGDYCQVRFFDEDTCYITMCDVAGHGVQGALLATRVSSEVRHWILQGQPPQTIVQLLNSFIHEHFVQTQNLIIGVQDDCLHDEPEHTLSLNPGDRLVFHTDGLMETADSTRTQLGINGLASLASVAMCVGLFDMADQILDQVAEYGPIDDDRTLIVAEIK